MFKAGFSQRDITPPQGTKKGGWMADLQAEVFLDPLYARVACFSRDDAPPAAIIQLDLLSFSLENVRRCRELLARRFDFPPDHILISATHNHAGPATARLAPVECQNDYVNSLLEIIAEAFAEARQQATEAEMGVSVVHEFRVSGNRRTLLRNGLVRCQAPYHTPDAMGPEGPIDPEVTVLLFRATDGRKLGCLVNFACHPTHHGGTNEISAGFPGVLARLAAEKEEIPVCMFINGAYGNVITCDYIRAVFHTQEWVGEQLHEDLHQALASMTFASDLKLASLTRRIALPVRHITDDEYHGRVPGAQRFRSDELYEKEIDHIRAKYAAAPYIVVPIQALRLGDLFFASAPCEYFCEFQLRLKQELFPQRLCLAGGANGMIGYVPTRAAFARGGYETTLGPPSRMAPETGDLIADCIRDLCRELQP